MWKKYLFTCSQGLKQAGELKERESTAERQEDRQALGLTALENERKRDGGEKERRVIQKWHLKSV